MRTLRAATPPSALHSPVHPRSQVALFVRTSPQPVPSVSRRSPRLLVAGALLLLFAAHAAGRIATSQPSAKLANSLPTARITAPGANADFASGTSITIAANATDNDGSIARVDFYAGSTLLGRDTTAPYAMSWSGAPIGTHALKVVAVDNRKASGASSVVSITVNANNDSIAPSVPTGLASTAQTSGSITLAWNAASDNVGGSGVAGYDVFHNGVLVGASTGTSYTDGGLQAGTGYSYAVRARDVAGNASARSASLLA